MLASIGPESAKDVMLAHDITGEWWKSEMAVETTELIPTNGLM